MVCAIAHGSDVAGIYPSLDRARDSGYIERLPHYLPGRPGHACIASSASGGFEGRAE
jgi:hypothetical protein